MAPTRKAPGVGHQLGRDTFASTGKSQRKSRSSKVLNDPPTGSQDGGLRMEAVALSPKTSSTCHKRPSYLSLDSFVVKPIHLHPSNVLEGFEVMWRQKILCDVTIIVGHHRMRVHKALLATCADYFRNLFANAPDDQKVANSEVCLEGISAATAEALIESMYTGKIQVSEANVRELLAAASSLKYYSIEEACDDFLQQRLNKSNCLRMLNLAFLYSLGDLTDEALHMAAQHFMELSDGFDFHQMDVDQLATLISRDDIKVPSELEVFQSVLSWLEYDRKSRLQYAETLLRSVRLPLLAPSDIVDHVETVEYLMNNSSCQQFVKEALHYHCLPARQSLLQSRRTCPRKLRKNVILAIGGAPRLKSDPVSQDVMYLDPDSGTWAPLTQLSQPRHHHAVAVVNGFLYVAGGEETNDQQSPLNTAFRYDPRTHTWLQIASMKKRRESFQLGALNDMLYAVGGRVDADISLAEVERYNPAVDQWELVAPLSSPRRSVAVATYNGRLYAMGGSGHKRISSKVERYNPLTDQWEARRSLLTPRFFALLASVGNKLFLIGGATLDNTGSVVCVPKVECYVPLTDTWVMLSGLLQPRAEAGCAVIGNTIYVVGGYSWDDNTRLSSTEVYKLDEDTWGPGPAMTDALTGVGCCCISLYDPKPLPHPVQGPGWPVSVGRVGAETDLLEDEDEGRAEDEDGLDSVAGENTQLQAPNSD